MIMIMIKNTWMALALCQLLFLSPVVPKLPLLGEGRAEGMNSSSNSVNGRY